MALGPNVPYRVRRYDPETKRTIEIHPESYADNIYLSDGTSVQTYLDNFEPGTGGDTQLTPEQIQDINKIKDISTDVTSLKRAMGEDGKGITPTQVAHVAKIPVVEKAITDINTDIIDLQTCLTDVDARVVALEHGGTGGGAGEKSIVILGKGSEIGTIIWYTGSLNGFDTKVWKVANGDSFSKTEFPELFTVLKSEKLPDLVTGNSIIAGTLTPGAISRSYMTGDSSPNIYGLIPLIKVAADVSDSLPSTKVITANDGNLETVLTSINNRLDALAENITPASNISIYDAVPFNIKKSVLNVREHMLSEISSTNTFTTSWDVVIPKVPNMYLKGLVTQDIYSSSESISHIECIVYELNETVNTGAGQEINITDKKEVFSFITKVGKTDNSKQYDISIDIPLTVGKSYVIKTDAIGAVSYNVKSTPLGLVENADGLVILKSGTTSSITIPDQSNTLNGLVLVQRESVPGSSESITEMKAMIEDLKVSVNDIADIMVQ